MIVGDNYDFLHHAVDSGNAELVRYLLDNFNFNVNRYGDFPYAIQHCYWDLIWLLLEKPELIVRITHFEQIISDTFLTAMKVREIANAEEEQLRLAKFLVEKFQFNLKSFSFPYNCSKETLAYLVSIVDLDKQNEDGDTRLHNVVRGSCMTTLKVVLPLIKDVNKRNVWGNTALDIALKGGFRSTGKFLLIDERVEVTIREDHSKSSKEFLSNFLARPDFYRVLWKKEFDSAGSQASDLFALLCSFSGRKSTNPFFKIVSRLNDDVNQIICLRVYGLSEDMIPSGYLKISQSNISRLSLGK